MQDRQALSSEKQPIESPKFPFEQLLIVDKSRKEIKKGMEKLFEMSVVRGLVTKQDAKFLSEDGQFSEV